jgi:hypothetical protein
MLVVKLTRRPFTMSSSPKAPSPNHQATKVSKQSSSRERHSQTVYDDGRSCCIVESRRRPRIVRGTNAADIERPQSGSALERGHFESAEHPSPRESAEHPTSRPPSYKNEDLALSRDRRVKWVSPKCPRKVVVVLASARSRAVKPVVENVVWHRWAELTPPPTPRLERLPSPELSDLDEAPFCECDETAVKKYCISCKKTVALLGR